MYTFYKYQVIKHFKNLITIRMSKLINLIRDLYPLFDLIQIPVYVKSDNGQYLYANRMFAEKFNLEPKQVIGKTIHDLAPPHISHLYSESDKDVYALGEKKTVPFITTFLDPHLFVNKIPLMNHLGTPKAILGFVGKNVFELKTIKYTTSQNKKVLLSPREVEICRLLAYGSSFKEIAKELEISPHTVVSHQKSIYTKLDIKSKTSLIFMYMGLA